MNAVVIIIDIFLILIAAVLILLVLMQEGQSQGLGAISGGAETFFGKNKAKSLEGKLAKITKIAASVFIVLAIVSTIIVSRYERDEEKAAQEALNELLSTGSVATDELVDTEDATGDETGTESIDSDAAAE